MIAFMPQLFSGYNPFHALEGQLRSEAYVAKRSAINTSWVHVTRLRSLLGRLHKLLASVGPTHTIHCEEET